MVDGIAHNNISPPPGCTVQQVHMMARHAERYPTRKAGARMLELVQRIENYKDTFRGELSFLNTWKYFTNGESK